MPAKLKMSFVLLALSVVGALVAESYLGAALWAFLLFMLWKGNEGARGIILMFSWGGLLLGLSGLALELVAIFALGDMSEVGFLAAASVAIGLLETVTAAVTLWSLRSPDAQRWLFNRSLRSSISRQATGA